MSIQDNINIDLQQAVIAKDKLKVSVLRMVKASLQNEAITRKQPQLGDETVLAVLKREAKKHTESMAAYQRGGREELAEKEKAELGILQNYLPVQLPREEVERAVDEIICSLEKAEQNFGTVMKSAMGKLKNKADGALVAIVVKEKINT